MKSYELKEWRKRSISFKLFNEVTLWLSLYDCKIINIKMYFNKCEWSFFKGKHTYYST